MKSKMIPSTAPMTILATSIFHLSFIFEILNYTKLSDPKVNLKWQSFGRYFIIDCKMNKNPTVEYLYKLGEGAYGQVYKGRMAQTGQVVAVKKINIDPEQEGIPSTVMRQITILKTLEHPNIVRLITHQLDLLCDSPKIELMFEYLEQDLAKRIKCCKRLTNQETKNVMYQILKGVEYMHSKRVFHRDLKPQNILINKNNEVKIADFGLGRILGKCPQTMSKEIQTLWYRAPELMLGEHNYSLAVDVWSLGCILYELAQGKVLFQSDSEIGQLFEIFKQCGTPKLQEWQEIIKLIHFRPSFPKFAGQQRIYENLSSLGIDLLEKMVILHPKNRISIADSLNHPFFTEKQ